MRKAREENEARFARGEQNLIEVPFRFSSPHAYRIFSGLVNRIVEGMLSVIDASRFEGQREKTEKIAARQAEDEARLRELERRAGIPESKTPDPQAEKAETIKKGFGAISEATKIGAKDKINEYDMRIRSALAGTPPRPGDTIDQLKKDFRFFSCAPCS